MCTHTYMYWPSYTVSQKNAMTSAMKCFWCCRLTAKLSENEGNFLVQPTAENLPMTGWKDTDVRFVRDHVYDHTYTRTAGQPENRGIKQVSNSKWSTYTLKQSSLLTELCNVGTVIVSEHLITKYRIGDLHIFNTAEWVLRTSLMSSSVYRQQCHII